MLVELAVRRVLPLLAALAALAWCGVVPRAWAQVNPCTTYENLGYTVCGQDFSANAPAVPISGYVLIATVPATNRNSVEVDNQSTDTVQVVRDDGTGAHASSVMLAPAASAGGQGGSYFSRSFKGRVRVYAPSAGDQVAAYQD